MDDIEHAVAMARAQVEHMHAGLSAHVVEGAHVAAGQVDDVDVIAHAGAVGRGIVVAEDVDVVELAHGDLGNIGHEVVRDALGVLADETALMGADGVEITQQHDVPALVGRVEVAQHLLVHRLGTTVGVRGGLELGLLAHRHVVGLAVHRGRGGEHDVVHAVVAKRTGQLQGAPEVVLIVLDGLVDGLAHGLEGGEVDGPADGLLLKNAVEQRPVLHVSLVEGADFLAGDALDALERDLAGVGQVVDHHDVVVGVEQLHAGVAADEAGAARNEDAGLFRLGHVLPLLLLDVWLMPHGAPMDPPCAYTPDGEAARAVHARTPQHYQPTRMLVGLGLDGIRAFHERGHLVHGTPQMFLFEPAFPDHNNCPARLHEFA